MLTSGKIKYNKKMVIYRGIKAFSKIYEAHSVNKIITSVQSKFFFPILIEMTFWGNIEFWFSAESCTHKKTPNKKFNIKYEWPYILLRNLILFAFSYGCFYENNHLLSPYTSKCKCPRCIHVRSASPQLFHFYIKLNRQKRHRINRERRGYKDSIIFMRKIDYRTEKRRASVKI